mmetsp:Transcript_68779/g.199546  ORF Transcript_68779/g.199546 Transcript_68779/m.199546 type:complete len:213 (+) Transcript_68779:67-705(+)
MDLHSQYPDHLRVRRYLGGFSQYRNQPEYTITRSYDQESGRPLPLTKTAAGHFGPGHYPVERDFPLATRLEEIPAGATTRSTVAPRFAMQCEDRRKSAERMLPGRDSPGPLAYRPLGQTPSAPGYTIPKNLAATGRPLPRAKAASDHLGPGWYRTRNAFDEAGWRKSQALLRAAKRNRETWASPQYSHIFRCMKSTTQRCASAPALPARDGA